ncbi:hypothetical protein CIG75_06030 [Tumebacillus algifaecis]|uniref:Colicin V production protein n=1 Tax=Tumebacillus algifaecis TaxID=1214604 RepID=A0A223CZU4_9BACL|nr:CvpA family protein [Tumebacillus algifaecis]ASS74596.1 hypothetical protein CIG75_06030 [Tumebacillus algifaecis]
MTDLVIGAFLVVAALNGLRNGLVKQIISLVGVFVAFFMARSFTDSLAPVIARFVPMPTLAPDHPLQLIPGLNLESQLHNGIAFIVLFLVIFFAIKLLGSALDMIAKLPGLSIMNRLAGLVLGAILGVVVAAVLVNVLALLPYEGLQAALDGSRLAQELLIKFPFFKLDLPTV